MLGGSPPAGSLQYGSAVSQAEYTRGGVQPVVYLLLRGVLVGARLGHCLFYEPSYYLHHIVEMLLPIRQYADGWKMVGYEGLASHGGVIGLLVAI